MGAGLLACQLRWRTERRWGLGGWYGKPSYVRSANRFWCATYFRNNNLGFRIVQTLQE